MTKAIVVDPSPGENCQYDTSSTQPGVLLCTRTTAPEQVRSGSPARFVYDACAGDLDQTFTSSWDPELSMDIQDLAGDFRWSSIRSQEGNSPHTIEIPAGHCARWTVHWDGRDYRGRPLPPSGYRVLTLVQNWGESPLASNDTFVVT